MKEIVGERVGQGIDLSTHLLGVRFDYVAEKYRSARQIDDWQTEEDLHEQLMNLVIDPAEDTESPSHFRMDDMAKLLMHMGHNPSELFRAWELSDGKAIRSGGWGELNSLLGASFFSMCELEMLRPGSTGYLSENFGILNFSRIDSYTRESQIVLDQFDKREDRISPYGLFVFSQADHNGAFNHLRALFGGYAGLDMYPQIKDLGYNERIAEVDSPQAFGRLLKKANSEFRPVSFCNLEVHGNQDLIAFKEDGVSVITKKDTQTQGFIDLGRFFDRNGTLILESCGTGKPGGIAQAISRAWGITVMGPQYDGVIIALQVAKNENGLVFNPHGVREGDIGIYRGGEEISLLNQANYIMAVARGN